MIACGMFELSVDNLIEEIIKLNMFYKNKPESELSSYGIDFNDKKREILCKTGFYLGLYRRYEWIDRLFKEYNVINHFKLELIHKNDKIPKKRRDEVWNKRFNGNQIGKCFTCEEVVDYQKGYHCGHIVSRYDGGNISVDNLEVVCSVCNLNMSTMNMMKYKSMF